MPVYEVVQRCEALPQDRPPLPPPRYVLVESTVANLEESENTYTETTTEPRGRSCSMIIGVFFVIMLLLALGTGSYHFMNPSHYNRLPVKEYKQSFSNWWSEYCPKNFYWFKQTNHCYSAIHKTTFDEAEAYCQSIGSHLASIHSEIEGIFITGLLRSIYVEESMRGETFRYGPYFIGLHKSNGTWQWVDGSRFEHDDWKYISNSSDSFHAKYKKNNEKHCSFCKKPSKLAVVQKTPNSQDTEGKNCISGYFWYEETRSCYSVSTLSLSFEDADKACKADNASLVSVHSEYENMIVNGLIVKKLENTAVTERVDTFWIGLTVRNGKYVWTDGSSSNYFHWYGGIPKYILDGDKYANHLYTAWKTPDSPLNGFVCKMDELVQT